MKIWTTIFFSLTINLLFGQQKFDTLFIGAKKYLLEKTKTFRSFGEDSPITLPSEYKELPVVNWEKVPKFKYVLSDTLIGIENDEEGNEIITSRWDFSCDTFKTYYLNALLDTISLSISDLARTRPFIKTGKKKIFFCAATIDCLFDKKMNRYRVYYLKDGYLFEYLASSTNSTSNVFSKPTALIVSGLYYTKGNETYYLHRKFVLRFK